MKQYCVGAPMERVALDLIGPLPLSHKGNKYVLIVSDLQGENLVVSCSDDR
jgi:hypothetical protein